MRKAIVFAVCAVMMLSFCAFSGAEEKTGTVAKVCTPNHGPLKLRASDSPKGRVLDEIPNGACILMTQEGEDWCQVVYREQEGYCKKEFLKLFPEADLSLLNYRMLRSGDRGEDVLALKKRMKELGYIRGAAQLSDVYTDVTKERVILFQRQTGMTEDGIASQELQAYLFSDQAPACTQTLPKVRSRVSAGDHKNRVICGCCMGEGCECCGFTGWIDY